MAKQQPEMTVRIPEDLLRKLLYVAKAEGRSPNNHILMLLRNNVQYFERAKGRMDPADLRSIDISEYEKEV
ncbi:MAG: Arc family DNA-binding protein [Clostridia bacterium]|nr:Arc family DNA-binding protein [Clostridia bacterium]